MKLKSKTTPASSHWLDAPLARLRAAQLPITRLQGQPDARILLIAPPPTQVEVDQNLCWCNTGAQIFFELLRSVTTLGPNDFLIVPAAFSPIGKNLKVAEASMTATIVECAAKSKQIKGFVCIGDAAFKSFFGFGRKPSMDALVGSVLQCSQTNHKPLIVFPDLAVLCFTREVGRELKMSFRDINNAESQRKAMMRTLTERQVFQKIAKLV